MSDNRFRFGFVKIRADKLQTGSELRAEEAQTNTVSKWINNSPAISVERSAELLRMKKIDVGSGPHGAL